MASVIVRNIHKSELRPKHNPPDGVDLNIGEWIIFEYQDETWLGQCLGWKLDGEQALVKTDLLDTFGRVDVPIDKVWRVRDSRDSRIDELEKLAEHWMEKYKDLMADRNQYKTLYESLHKAYVEKPSTE